MSNRDIFTTTVRTMMADAPQSVMRVEVFSDMQDDSFCLGVVHRLFYKTEFENLADLRRLAPEFRRRVEAAMLITAPKQSRELVVERRSFLARAARIRKAKPRKVRQ